MDREKLKPIAQALAEEQLLDLEYLTIVENYDGELTEEEMYEVLNLVTTATVVI